MFLSIIRITNIPNTSPTKVPSMVRKLATLKEPLAIILNSIQAN